MLRTMTGSTASPDYSPINHKDSDSVDGLDMLPLPTRNQTKRRRLLGMCKVLTAILVLGFIVLTFALSFHAVDLLGQIGHKVTALKPASHGPRSYKYPCGTTASEAKAKGCIFDVMSMAWQSPECYDPDLAEEFMDLGPWEFYADQEGSQMLSYEQVSQAGQISWTTRRYFVQHCIFGWKAMHRAWQRGWRMDANLASIAHTELCSRVFANTSIPLDAMSTRIHVDFPSCN